MKNLRLIFMLTLFTSWTGCSLQSFDFTESGTGFVLKSVESMGKTRNYCLYVPATYTEDSAWPLMIFFHGSGERGLDGKKQCGAGLGPAVLDHPEWFPCLVLFPQESKDLENPWEEALEQTLRDYSIDRNRIYLTGISVGGTATWIEGARQPELFAALMPVCGEGNPDQAALYLNKPIWVFHGRLDKIISVEESREMFRLIQGLGGNIKYTEYPETGHECWDKVYNDPDVISWLLNCRLDRIISPGSFQSALPSVLPGRSPGARNHAAFSGRNP